MVRIILASQSPRRKQLLDWAEVPYTVVARSTDETYPEGMPVEEIPIHIARQKANETNSYLDAAYHKQYSDKTILAADTIVVLDDQVINKPTNRADAIRMLTLLSGRTHKVITGVVIHTDHYQVAFSETTEVEFYELTADQIEFYIDKFKPFDKAGSYAIQEWIGVIGIKRINGDFYNVMGLPISRVVRELDNLEEPPAQPE
ncbi:Maf family nucleotide pyrophosphatase [Aridibaculum aurantiacum]|uniref:Maf family nucleotide pyrophosphatase n=1 Tax=Aridibaculum aurantiacum TaxID=2810307 RepID=UPI001A96397F|nr:Maf family protein [Aridibaculum aurantiacum]